MGRTRNAIFADNADETLQTLFDVSKELERSPAQVALRWVLEQRAMTSVIVGARHTGHLRDNLGAAGWRLHGDARQKTQRCLSFTGSLS